ncbi:DUF6431 domain-containing protein [Caldifermentibacillus hisashii]|uniref:DUF6431 domain-containing protein n=1 Tax=Caldifermentibacillus hisashii TaxID=996558 RepID=UPI0031FD8FB2
MIILHDFGISLEEYAINGKKNKFPTFDKCPNCNCVASGNLHRHGYYWRNAIAEEKEVKIPICRIICLSCKKTFSIIPDFLIPYFQHSLEIILKRIEQFLEKKKSKSLCQNKKYTLERGSGKLIISFFAFSSRFLNLIKIKWLFFSKKGHTYPAFTKWVFFTALCGKETLHLTYSHIHL